MTTPAVNINFVSLVPFFHRSATCGGPLVTGLTGTVGRLRWLEQRPASVSRKKQSSGWRDPTPWTHLYLQSIDHPSGVSGHKSSCGGGNFTVVENENDGINLGGIYSLVDPPQAVIDRATTKAYLRLKDSPVNLSVAFAERKETEELFVGAVHDIASAVKSFKKQSPKEWLQVIKNGINNQWHNIPHRWLELQYGWKPLMSDVQGACEALDRRERDGQAYYCTAVGKAKDEKITRTRYGVDIYQDVEIKEQFSCIVKLFYYLQNPLVATFASLGITNPAELIWERVPYSFVVDWFLPVGSWLSSWDADLGWIYKTGIQSKLTRVTGSGKPGCTSSTPTSIWYNNQEPWRAKGYKFTRTLLPSPPGVGLPHFKNPLSGVHIANACSLLVNLFRHA